MKKETFAIIRSTEKLDLNFSVALFETGFLFKRIYENENELYNKMKENTRDERLGLDNNM